MKNVFNFLLAVLCCADILFILSNVLLVAVALGHQVPRCYHQFAQCLCQVSLSFSIFMIITLTIDRHKVTVYSYFTVWFQICKITGSL